MKPAAAVTRGSAVDSNLSIEIAKNRLRDAIGVGVETVTIICPTCEPTFLRTAGRLAPEVGIFWIKHFSKKC